jgi:hypothetical protein
VIDGRDKRVRLELRAITQAQDALVHIARCNAHAAHAILACRQLVGETFQRARNAFGCVSHDG